MSRLLQGLGGPTPYVFLDVDPRSIAPVLYAYHEGDLFTPGTGNFVFEHQLEFPVTDLDGGGSGAIMGISYRMNAWPVWPTTSPVVMDPMITRAGYGGLQAGAFIAQPLLDPDSENG